MPNVCYHCIDGQTLLIAETQRLSKDALNKSCFSQTDSLCRSLHTTGKGVTVTWMEAASTKAVPLASQQSSLSFLFWYLRLSQRLERLFTQRKRSGGALLSLNPDHQLKSQLILKSRHRSIRNLPMHGQSLSTNTADQNKTLLQFYWLKL